MFPNFPQIFPALLLLSLLMGACGIGSIPCFAQQPAKTFRIPFHTVNSLILLDTAVNAKPVVLLLDTGSSHTILSVASAPIPEYRHNEAIHGKALQVSVLLNLSANFGSAETVTAMNLDTVEKQMGARFDGILGQDILRTFAAVRIDFKTQVVELETKQ